MQYYKCVTNRVEPSLIRPPQSIRTGATKAPTQTTLVVCLYTHRCVPIRSSLNILPQDSIDYSLAHSKVSWLQCKIFTRCACMHAHGMCMSACAMCFHNALHEYILTCTHFTYLLKHTLCNTSSLMHVQKPPLIHNPNLSLVGCLTPSSEKLVEIFWIKV